MTSDERGPPAIRLPGSLIRHKSYRLVETQFVLPERLMSVGSVVIAVVDGTLGKIGRVDVSERLVTGASVVVLQVVGQRKCAGAVLRLPPMTSPSPATAASA